MNAALLLMTSSFMAGADAPAAAPAAPAPAAVAGAGCGSCDPCASKPSLFDRIKGRIGCHKKHHNDCCAPAPTCAPAPAPKCCAPAPAPTCDACGSARPNLLDKIKGKLQSKKHKGDCCAPACDGCGAPAPAPAPPANMPKPMDPKKTGVEIPTPGAIAVPSIPVTPVTGNSPY